MPTDKQIGGGSRDEGSAERSPDNIAPVCAFLAGTGSDWLTGRVLGAGGHQVRLWNFPEVVESIDSDGPWDLHDLAAKAEKAFRPRADSQPPAIFTGQLPT